LFSAKLGLASVHVLAIWQNQILHWDGAKNTKKSAFLFLANVLRGLFSAHEH
jgi:hypothetical protein